MAKKPNHTLKDLEFDKFDVDSSGNTAVNTIIGGGTVQLSGITVSGRISEVSLTTSWQQIIVTPLVNRKGIAFQNQSDNGGIIKYNYVNTAGDAGWNIEDGGFKDLVADSSTVYKFYMKMVTGTGTVVIDEIA